MDTDNPLNVFNPCMRKKVNSLISYITFLMTPAYVAESTVVLKPHNCLTFFSKIANLLELLSSFTTPYLWNTRFIELHILDSLAIEIV